MAKSSQGDIDIFEVSQQVRAYLVFLQEQWELLLSSYQHVKDTCASSQQDRRAMIITGSLYQNTVVQLQRKLKAFAAPTAMGWGEIHKGLLDDMKGESKLARLMCKALETGSPTGIAEAMGKYEPKLKRRDLLLRLLIKFGDEWEKNPEKSIPPEILEEFNAQQASLL